jgi:hypothetical protein
LSCRSSAAFFAVSLLIVEDYTTMVFSCNPSVPSCIVQIVLQVESSQEISTSTCCRLGCLLRGVSYTSRYVQKPATLSRHHVRKRQGPSLKTPSLNPTDTSGCQRCIPRSSAETLAPSFPQKLLPQTLSCVCPFLGYFPANLLTTFLPHLYLIYRLNVDSNLCSYSTIIPPGNLV